MPQEQSEPEPESDIESWMYPYLAGALDFTGGISIGVYSDKSRKLDYGISPRIRIINKKQTPIGMMMEICDHHDISTHVSELKSGSYQLEINNNRDIDEFLQIVGPFVIGSVGQIELMVEHILPALEDGEHHNRQGFINVMYHVEKIREQSEQRGTPKYTKEFFEDEWSQYL